MQGATIRWQGMSIPVIRIDNRVKAYTKTTENIINPELGQISARVGLDKSTASLRSTQRYVVRTRRYNS